MSARDGSGTRSADAQRVVDRSEVQARIEQAQRALTDSGARSPAAERRVLEERARELARPLRQDDAGARREFLLATVGGRRLGMETVHVHAVLRRVHPTPIPGAAPPLTAVVAWRGRLLPCLDIAPLLGAAPAEAGEAAPLVVLGRAEPEIGVLAEAVEELATLAEDELRSVPPGSPAGEWLLALTDDAVPLLDAAALLRRFGAEE